MEGIVCTVATHLQLDTLTSYNFAAQSCTYVLYCGSIDLFQEGVAIILCVTRDDSRLAEAVANTNSTLTLGCLDSIVRDFLTCQ